MSWDPKDLERLGRAEEVELASRRPNGSVSRSTVMWVVRVGDELFVRSAYGPGSAWYRRAVRYGHGVVRGGGADAGVVLDVVPVEAHDTHEALDAAYHAKYDRHGPRIVGTVVGPDAAAVTIRLVPEEGAT